MDDEALFAKKKPKPAGENGDVAAQTELPAENSGRENADTEKDKNSNNENE